MIYYPDKWLVLRLITPEETFYKVFATWYGGYYQGDSWKLNSGIESCSIKEGRIEFLGSSGSIYSCMFDMQGTTGYGSTVLSGLVDSANGTGVSIEVVMFDSIDELKDIFK